MTDERKKLAVISTCYSPGSHTDVIVSRWLDPFPTDAKYGWENPRCRIASLYVEQRKPFSDLTLEKKVRFGLEVYDSIEAALTLGGDHLAVHGILLIAEHGDYPENELGQKLYPRKEFFDRIMAVFRASGRKVPIFFDKHYSWNPDWIREMAEQVKCLDLPLFGGSSISLLPLSQPLDIPPNHEIKEVVALYYGALEAYLFHSVDCVQSLLENRPESVGVSEIIAWKDAEVWKAMDRGEFAEDLLIATGAAVSAEARESLRTLIATRNIPVFAFQLRYVSGLRVTHFMQRDTVRKWAFAVRHQPGDEIAAAYWQTNGPEDFFPHFARLCRKIDDFIAGGESPIPQERLYITSMTTALCLRALGQPGQALPTPELAPDSFESTRPLCSSPSGGG